ncbi:MAG: type III-B CRISPR module RAMP protein Cmr4 [bacterium]|nr:type III-B CRISPR module RAMP protein Cmr4 [bacterium]
MTTNLYIVEPITNLHVGSGKENYGVVDNLIQRDATTGLPCINASSLKGALREHVEQKVSKEQIRQIFGSAPTESDTQSGSYRFFDAHLLALPVRGERSPYYLATCPQVIEDFQKQVTLFAVPEADRWVEALKSLLDLGQNIALKQNAPDKDTQIRIEDLPIEVILKRNNSCYAENALLGQLFNRQPILMLSNMRFRELCDNNHLPVIARNYLNNGESKNLFYEQVLPRYSLLYFLAVNTTKEVTLAIDGELVQIGANASVGNGFCKLRKG